MGGRVTVQTTSGPVTGSAGYQFLGIPYGTAKRFQTARQAAWSTPKDCTKYGNMALQPNFLGKKPPQIGLKIAGSEDCLNLNIWTPSIDAGSKLPVVIYVHGGAFQTGSNCDPERRGDRFARDTPMMFVSVNYRLGVLGGLYLADLLGEEYRDSGSNSVLDILLAVRWVKDNAAAFGGDPENITLMGISAGAKGIGALMTLEESGSLFSKVILESGAVQAFRSRDAAKELRDRYMTYLEGASLQELLSLPAEKLIEAQAKFCDRNGSVAFFGPVLDGVIFQDEWLTRWENGRVWKGKALIGSGFHEMRDLAEQPDFCENPVPVLQDLFGGNADTVCKFHDSGVSWTRTLSDAMYRSASDRLAARLTANGDDVWVYSFDFPPARHGMGFHFMMRQESAPFCQVPEQELPDARRTAELMNRCARNFIACGDPDSLHDLGWQTINAGSQSKLCFGRQLTERPFHGDSLTGMPEYTYCERSVQK